MTERPARRLLVVMLGLALAGGPTAHAAKKEPEKKDDPIRRYELGLQLLNQARPDRAVIELEKAARLDPGSPIIHYALGLAYMGMRDWKHSEATFLRVLELDPLFTDAHNNLGVIYSELNDLPRARAEWERCLADTKYRTPEVVRFNIGKTLLQQGKPEEAVTHLKMAVEVRPLDAEWQIRHGAALQALERWDEAAVALEAALKTKPSSLEALFQLALVSLQRKDITRARACLGRVQEIAPGTVLATRASELLKSLGA